MFHTLTSSGWCHAANPILLNMLTSRRVPSRDQRQQYSQRTLTIMNLMMMIIDVEEHFRTQAACLSQAVWNNEFLLGS